MFLEVCNIRNTVPIGCFCTIKQLIGRLFIAFSCFIYFTQHYYDFDSFIFVFSLQTHAHSSLVYLVSLLGSMEHSFHHTLLLEIRALTDRYPSLLGGCGKDIYRMSNSFTAMARLLGRRLEENMAAHCRSGKSC